MRNTTEQLLLERAKRFDQAALAEIFDRYNAGVYRYALRLLGDPDMARECMSETFSRFLSALRRGVGPDNYLQAYLYRIAHNWITDYYRSNPARFVPLDPELRADPSDEPSHVVTNHNQIQQVRSALASLTPDQRQVVTLKYLENWQNEEIAQALNKPIGAVKALQHRAIESLRRILSLEMEMDDETN